MRGDVNDEPPAATTQILLGPPVRRSARQASSATGAMPGGCGTSLRLIPRGALLQPPLPWTRRLADHLLVSHSLVHRVEHVDTGPGEPPSITEDPTDRRDETASDHAPVWARIDLG